MEQLNSLSRFLSFLDFLFTVHTERKYMEYGNMFLIQAKKKSALFFTVHCTVCTVKNNSNFNCKNTTVK